MMQEQRFERKIYTTLFGSLFAELVGEFNK